MKSIVNSTVNSTVKTILLLGGTADGRRLAMALHERAVRVIYSVAGLVRLPDVACETLVGGFTQFGGLPNYLKSQGVDAILDVTHPYAEKMSSTAVAAAEQCGIPCWRFHRPAWQPQEGDRWIEYEDWERLIPLLADKKSLFLSVGQLSQREVELLGAVHQPADNVGGQVEQRQLLRTAVEPKVQLLPTMSWIKAIGPFKEDDERALMLKYKIDALVSKNSGGEATVAKLVVARELGLTVYMQKRPMLPEPTAIFSTLEACVNRVEMF